MCHRLQEGLIKRDAKLITALKSLKKVGEAIAVAHRYQVLKEELAGVQAEL